jgi:hypothetical protein
MNGLEDILGFAVSLVTITGVVYGAIRYLLDAEIKKIVEKSERDQQRMGYMIDSMQEELLSIKSQFKDADVSHARYDKELSELRTRLEINTVRLDALNNFNNKDG